MSALSDCVELGIVSVERAGGGFTVAGARGDITLELELEAMGAVWREAEGVYFVASEGRAASAMIALTKRTKAAKAALAARIALAQERGMKLFDNERKRQQRKITREIKAVYAEAMAEHAAEINRIRRAADNLPADADAAEYFKLLNRRKELEGVYDALAGGLAKAGQSAQQLMDSHLMSAAASSRSIATWQVSNMAGVNVARIIGNDYAALAVSGVTSYHGKYDLKAWEGVADRAQCRAAIKKAVARGLLTGEHPERIAKRFEGLFEGDEPLSPHARAVRIARTETNRVMNEASLERLRTLDAKGVKVKKQWKAHLDSETRDSHRDVHNEVRDTNEKFSNGCLKPGDGGPAESINCRCSLSPYYEGLDLKVVPLVRDSSGRLRKQPPVSYSKWSAENGGQ